MSRNFDGGERLEENKDYRVYRYGDDLKPGYELKVEHSVLSLIHIFFTKNARSVFK